MAKNKTKREFKKKVLPPGIVQQALPYDAIVDGGLEQYKKAINVIEVYRQLARLVDQRMTNYEIVTAKYKYDEKYGVGLKMNLKGAHEESIAQSPPVPGRKPQPLNSNKGKIGAQRQYWHGLAKMVADKGGPRFSSHMWDQLNICLSAARKAKQHDYNAKRHFLVVQGRFEALKLERYPMPVLRAPDCGREYASIRRDDDGRIVMTVRYGGPEDTIDFVLHGKVKKENGDGAYSVFLKRGDYRKYILEGIIAGTFSWSTPLINVVQRKNANGQSVTRFSINIPFKRPARFGPKENTRGEKAMPDLDPDKVCEVVWDVVPGNMLKRRPWNDVGTDDAKTSLIHAVVVGDKQRECWGKHIFVDAAAENMRHRQARKKKLENLRDTCRRVKRLVRPIRETMSGMAKQRERVQKDCNCCWSKDIVFFAQRARCGTIRLFSVPDGAKKGLLLDGSIPWDWYQFVQRVTHLANEKGMKVVEVKDIAPAEIMGMVKEADTDSGVAACMD